MFSANQQANKAGTKLQWIDKLGRTNWSPTINEITSDFTEIIQI